jgi:hypothetical protein
LRKLAQEKYVGLATAHKAVRENMNIFPYKVTAAQEFKPADHEKRIRYCEWFTKFIQKKPVDNIAGSYSTRFYLWGAAKSAVYHDRPHTLSELKTAITAYVRNISQAD